MTGYYHRILKSPSLYPLGTFWLIAMGIIPAIVADWIKMESGLIILTGVALVLVLIAEHRDTLVLAHSVTEVHELVNSETDRLVNRITELTALLELNRIHVPAQPYREEIGS